MLHMCAHMHECVDVHEVMCTGLWMSEENLRRIVFEVGFLIGLGLMKQLRQVGQ